MKSNDLVAIDIATMHREFEQWWESDGQYCRAGGGDYEKTFAFRAYEAAIARANELNTQPTTGYTAVDMTTAADQGFRDGRDSVVVQLPELRGDSDADDIAGVGLVIPMFDRGYDEAIEQCRAAIIAAGGKVKE